MSAAEWQADRDDAARARSIRNVAERQRDRAAGMTLEDFCDHCCERGWWECSLRDVEHCEMVEAAADVWAQEQPEPEDQAAENDNGRAMGPAVLATPATPA